MIALCSLVVAGIPLVSTLGFTAAIAVVVAVARGDHAAAGDARRARATASTRCACSSASPTPTTASRTAGRRWARGVAERPWRSAIASLAILLVLAIPVLQLELGQNDTSALPNSTTARQAYDSLTTGSGPASTGRC